jgi:hypothetical protein
MNSKGNGQHKGRIKHMFASSKNKHEQSMGTRPGCYMVRCERHGMKRGSRGDVPEVVVDGYGKGCPACRKEANRSGDNT